MPNVAGIGKEKNSLTRMDGREKLNNRTMARSVHRVVVVVVVVVFLIPVSIAKSCQAIISYPNTSNHITTVHNKHYHISFQFQHLLCPFSHV